MKCPNCNKNIPDSAVRCKYCRKALNPVFSEDKYNGKNKILNRVKGKISYFCSYGKDSADCPWPLASILAVIIFTLIFIRNDCFGIGTYIVNSLKGYSRVMTRDPRLGYYLVMCVNTIVLKGAVFFFLVLVTLTGRVSFREKVLSSGEVPHSWGTWMLPLYISFCFGLRAFILAGPLVANIPFNSVFPNARIVGNIFMLFSILIVAPFVEEVIFRGFLYPVFNRFMGIYPAILITASLFVLAHFPVLRDNLVFTVVLFVLGGVITYVRAVTGSTRLAIIMHAWYNFVAVSVGFFDYLIFKY